MLKWSSAGYIIAYGVLNTNLFTRHTEPPTFHLIFSYYIPINAVFFKPFPYVHGYTLYHMHEKGWGWMLSNL